MWIFTSGSFVSLVTDRDDPKKLLVRARKVGHIEALFPTAKVFQMEDADYRFRAVVTRKSAEQVVAKQVASIGYDNFKNSISEPAYHCACQKVWKAMHGLQASA